MVAPTISILSATQRTDGSFLVDVIFEVADADGDNLTIIDTEFSENGGALTAAQAQLSDRKHTAVSPLTGITITPKFFQFVWNAFQDLSEDDFNSVSFRIEVTDGVTPVEDTLTNIEVNTEVPPTIDEIRQNRLTRRRRVDRSPLDFLGFGLVIPFERGSSDFKFASGITLIESSLRQLLLTRGETGNSVGEIPWRPDLGASPEQFRQRRNDPILAQRIFTYVAGRIPGEQGDPRIILKDVQAIQQDTTFTLRFVFDIIDENVPENRVFLEDRSVVVEVGL